MSAADLANAVNGLRESTDAPICARRTSRCKSDCDVTDASGAAVSASRNTPSPPNPPARWAFRATRTYGPERLPVHPLEGEGLLSPQPRNRPVFDANMTRGVENPPLEGEGLLSPQPGNRLVFDANMTRGVENPPLQGEGWVGMVFASHITDANRKSRRNFSPQSLSRFNASRRAERASPSSTPADFRTIPCTSI